MTYTHVVRPFFAQVMDTPRLSAVFVDPGELSFHSLENIVPLDRWFETRPGFSSDDDLLLYWSRSV